MKYIATTVVALLVLVFPSKGETLRLEGESFRPKAHIIWAATNAVPPFVTIYKMAPQTFSGTAVSNAMHIGSFTLLNRIPSADKTVLRFQDKRDKLQMTRFLEISEKTGWVNYYDGHAEGNPSRGVPTFRDAEDLAVDYLNKLGVNTNQLIAKPWPRTQTEVTIIDKKGGREPTKEISMRGIFLFRQIDGIQISGDSFWIHFCNDAKPSMFQLTWPKLEPVKGYKTAKPEEILNWVRFGRAVNPEPEAKVVQDVPLAVTKITPYYLGKVGLTQQEIIYPYAKLELIADVGGTNRVTFYLHCPIIAEGQPQ